jgi:DNA helicase-2/ATP-dependent DNA helicase PcrA
MNFEAELNPEQHKAVLQRKGPLLILAGAGSGKTRVITYRIAHLIQQQKVDPSRILAVTFTNKAAREMHQRVDDLVSDARGVWMSTFHAFGARILRRHADRLGWTSDFLIYDQDDSKRLGKTILKELDLDPNQYPVERMLRMVEKKKHSLRSASGNSSNEIAKKFFARYQKRLQKANAFDFADLIFQTHRLWSRFPEIAAIYRDRFEYVLVDEFQDTDRAQYQLLKMLCDPESNLCVVGDDDQSIYRWRDADITHILGFRRDFPKAKTIKLERNYRSTRNILAAAGSIIACNSHRHEKTLWTDSDSGDPVLIFQLDSERHEADLVAKRVSETVSQGTSLKDIAVFYRVNALSRTLEESFRLYGLPYIVVGGTRFFDRMEIKDMVAYLRLMQNPHSDIDLLRIINVPARGIGQTTRRRLQETAQAAGLSIWEILYADYLDELRNAEKNKVLGFRRLIDELRENLVDQDSAEVILQTIERTGYLEMLKNDGTEQSLSRQENLRELVSAAMEYSQMSEDSSLIGFLEHVALVSDIDQADNKAGAVSMMTLHSAKGLEFDHVFMVGLEEGLLPHYRSLTVLSDEQDYLGANDLNEEDIGGVEEERRLCYVGMTRAKKTLCLSCAQSRMLFGRIDQNPASRFLGELPEELTVSNVGHSRRSADQSEVVDLYDVDLDDDDDIMIDYSDEYNQSASDEDRYANEWIGEKVVHPTMGRGLVLAVSQSPNGLKLRIDFQSVGQKTVLASYVKIEPSS